MVINFCIGGEQYKKMTQQRVARERNMYTAYNNEYHLYEWVVTHWITISIRFLRDACTALLHCCGY